MTSVRHAVWRGGGGVTGGCANKQNSPSTLPSIFPRGLNLLQKGEQFYYTVEQFYYTLPSKKITKIPEGVYNSAHK